MTKEEKIGRRIVKMARDPENDVAQDFIDAIHSVLIDVMRSFIEKHWDEDENVWYEGCNIYEAFEWIDLHFTPIKKLA